MRRVSALALVLLLAAPASAQALSRRLFVDGDSLAVGTKTYLPKALRGWRVTQSATVGRPTSDGVDILRSYGRGLPRVIHVSLGTNDDPSRVSSFRAAIREVMDIAGPRRCVVWTNIVRPAVAGVSYAGLNRALAAESRPRENLRVVNWARMVREHPEWLSGDGVHASAEGYRARANAIARSVRRCR